MTEERDIFVDEGKSVGELIAALKRHRKLALLTALGIFIVGTVIVFILPNSYTSTATILIEEPEVPVELIQTTVTTYGARQIQTISQRVMTRTNLANIIKKFDLYADKRKYMPTLLLVDEVREKINLDLVDIQTTDPATGREAISTIAFMLGFEDKNPTVARKVANELVSLYLDENVRTRTVQTAETSQFLAEEVERLGAEVQSIETKLAKFKEENEGSLPELSILNIQMMQRVDSDLLEVNSQLKSIEESRILLQSQLSQLSRTAPMVLSDGSVVISPEEQLKALQTQLAVLEGRYGENHPDIVRTRRDIQALQQSTGIQEDLTEIMAALMGAKARLLTAKERYGAEHPEVKRLERLVESLAAKSEVTVASGSGMSDLPPADNPAYLQVEASLKQLDANEKSYREQQVKLQESLAKYEQRLLRGPQLERELARLQRDLSTATTRYLTMQGKLFGAEMGENLETQSKGERFTLVEPPNLPLEPSSPNRAALLLLVLFISVVGGVAVMAIRESISNAISGARMVDAIPGAFLIAEIPIIANEQDLAHSRRVRLLMLVGVPVTLVLLMLITHFAVRPLDVLWYTALRQLGLL